MPTYVMMWDGSEESWPERDYHRRRTRSYGTAECRWPFDGGPRISSRSLNHFFLLQERIGIVAHGWLERTVRSRGARFVEMTFRELLDNGDCLPISRLRLAIPELDWSRLRNCIVRLPNDCADILAEEWEGHVVRAGFQRSQPHTVHRPRFEVGGLYNRSDIHDSVGGRRFGRISVPAESDCLLLFASRPDEQVRCADRWTETGELEFLGEGQRGDMAFVRGNEAIRDHHEKCRVLHLFEPAEEAGTCRYAGQFDCVGSRFRSLGQGRGRRRVIVFRLAPVTTPAPDDELGVMQLAPRDAGQPSPRDRASDFTLRLVTGD